MHSIKSVSDDWLSLSSNQHGRFPIQLFLYAQTTHSCRHRCSSSRCSRPCFGECCNCGLRGCNEWTLDALATAFAAVLGSLPGQGVTTGLIRPVITATLRSLPVSSSRSQTTKTFRMMPSSNKTAVTSHLNIATSSVTGIIPRSFSSRCSGLVHMMKSSSLTPIDEVDATADAGPRPPPHPKKALH